MVTSAAARCVEPLPATTTTRYVPGSTGGSCATMLLSSLEMTTSSTPASRTCSRFVKLSPVMWSSPATVSASDVRMTAWFGERLPGRLGAAVAATATDSARVARMSEVSERVRDMDEPPWDEESPPLGSR
jgi:hypothetical protein